MFSTVSSLFAASAPLAQGELLHRRGLERIAALRKEQMVQAEELGRREITEETSFFCKDQSTELEVFAESMKVKQDVARREAMRDVWFMRTQLNLTMILVTGIMFASAFENFSQAEIPRASPQWILYCLAVSTGLGILLIGISLWSCFKLQTRMSGFVVGDRTVVYCCRKRHENFNEYYSCHCHTMRGVSMWSFYLGTIATMASAAAVQAPKYIYLNHDNASAVAFAIISVAIPVILVGAGDLIWPGQTHSDVLDFGGLAEMGGETGTLTRTAKQHAGKSAAAPLSASEPY